MDNTVYIVISIIIPIVTCLVGIIIHQSRKINVYESVIEIVLRIKEEMKKDETK